MSDIRKEAQRIAKSRQAVAWIEGELRDRERRANLFDELDAKKRLEALGWRVGMLGQDWTVGTGYMCATPIDGRGDTIVNAAHALSRKLIALSAELARAFE